MMFLKGFEGWHILIIVGLLVVLFGARKLPDSARSIGQSLRIFKSEMKAAGHDGDAEQDTDQQPEASTSSQPQALEQTTTTASTGNGDAGTNPVVAHVVHQDAATSEGVRR